MGKLFEKIFVAVIAGFGLFGAIFIVYSLGVMISETRFDGGHAANDNFECGRMGCE